MDTVVSCCACLLLLLLRLMFVLFQWCLGKCAPPPTTDQADRGFPCAASQGAVHASPVRPYRSPFPWPLLRAPFPWPLLRAPFPCAPPPMRAGQHRAAGSTPQSRNLFAKSFALAGGDTVRLSAEHLHAAAIAAASPPLSVKHFSNLPIIAPRTPQPLSRSRLDAATMSSGLGHDASRATAAARQPSRHPIIGSNLQS